MISQVKTQFGTIEVQRGGPHAPGAVAILALDRARQEKESARLVAGWAKRRTWSRTDTARWLNERSAAVLAWLRRKPGAWPGHSNQIGYWLKDGAPRVFDRVHSRLGAGNGDEARAAMLPGEVLR